MYFTSNKKCLVLRLKISVQEMIMVEVVVAVVDIEPVDKHD